MLGSGIQYVSLGDGGRAAEPPVSVAPPVGQRDTNLPVRGRDRLLAELAGGGPGVRVVHGLGGCGKTRLALEAAWAAQQAGVEAWWVSAADRGVLAAGMRAVGRRLGVPEADLEHGDAADVIWHCLAARQDRWLLVIDNADDPQLLAGAGRCVADGQGWLRPGTGPAGMVLVTSRDGAAATWGPWCQRYRLGMLSPGEAAGVLADHVGRHPGLGNDKDAQALAMRLGGLPLALKIAGAYLAASAAIPAAFADPGAIGTYRQYLAAVEAGPGTVFPAAGGELTQEQARSLIGVTWDLTLDRLDARQLPEARHVLRLLATFADAPVPYQLLLAPAVLAGSPPLAGITGPRLWQALTALDDFGLIDLTPASQDPAALPAARLHPLVRDTSRPPAGTSEQMTMLGMAARLLTRAAAETGLPEDPAMWPAWQLLAPHAAHVFRSLTAEPDAPDDETAQAAYAAHMTARCGASQGLHAQAEAEYRAVLAARVRVQGADHPDTPDHS